MAKTDGFKFNPGWRGPGGGATPPDGALSFGFTWTGMYFGENSGRGLQEGKCGGCVLHGGARLWGDAEDLMVLDIDNSEGLKEVVLKYEGKQEDWGPNGDGEEIGNGEYGTG